MKKHLKHAALHRACVWGVLAIGAVGVGCRDGNSGPSAQQTANDKQMRSDKPVRADQPKGTPSTGDSSQGGDGPKIDGYVKPARPAPAGTATPRTPTGGTVGERTGAGSDIPRDPNATSPDGDQSPTGGTSNEGVGAEPNPNAVPRDPDATVSEEEKATSGGRAIGKDDPFEQENDAATGAGEPTQGEMDPLEKPSEELPQDLNDGDDGAPMEAEDAAEGATRRAPTTRPSAFPAEEVDADVNLEAGTAAASDGPADAAPGVAAETDAKLDAAARSAEEAAEDTADAIESAAEQPARQGPRPTFDDNK